MSVVSSKDLEEIKVQLQKGKAKETRPSDWQAQLDYSLLLAVTNQQPAIVEELLEAGANLHQYDQWYPIAFAALDLGDEDTFNVLFKRLSAEELQVGLQCHLGTLLHAAVRSGKLTIVQNVCALFKQNNINLNTTSNTDEVSPLHVAVKSVPMTLNVEFEKHLENCDADMDIEATVPNRKRGSSRLDEEVIISQFGNENTSSEPILKEKIMKHDLSILRFLLSKNMDINAQSANGRTPLHDAAYLGYLDEVTLLLKHGADPQIVDQSHQIPWMCALNNNHQQVMEILMAQSDIGKTRLNGKSLLHLACSSGSMSCTRLLVEKGADVTCTDNEGYTPFMEAINISHVAIVKYFIENTACDVNFICKDKYALGCALKNNHHSKDHKEILDVLINAGANTNLKNSKGRTPIMEYFHSEESKLWLLDNGANINMVSEDGYTTLFAATELDSSYGADHVSKLIAMNVDIGLSDNVCEHNQTTPLLQAIKNKNHELCKVLLNAGASRKLLKQWLQTNSAADMKSDEDMVPVLARLELCAEMPLGLQDVARQAILRALGQGNVDIKIEQLAVPQLMRQFLSTDVYMRWNEAVNQV